MIPILFQTMTEGTVPTNYGIGPLSDCISCTVTEERNGGYELAMTYAVEGIHASEIEPNRFILAKPNYTDDPQIFRIYKIGKTINGSFTVNAQHISYDLSGKVISSGTASSAVAACALLQAKAGSFTINTDKTVSAAFSITAPSSVRSWFGGKEGSLLDIYGGEWKYDNYTASLKQARGSDRGVEIRYAKNLTQLSQMLDMSNLCTGVIPFYIDQDGNKTVGTKVSTGLSLDVDRDIAIDFSQDVDPESGTAISTQLANLANAYITNTNLTSITNSITLDFVQSGKLTERVDLCDTVHIYFEALGISAAAKCVKTVWNVLEERYTSTTFGDARTNICDTIASAQKQLQETPSTSFMAEAIAHATELITGNLGGYVILHDSDGNGEPDEILIMNTPDISTSTKIWRWNASGLGYSSTGYAGPYGTAITSDGKIVANYVSTGTLNADLIKAGTIEDVGHNSTINMTNGEAVLNQLKAKTQFNLIDSNNVTRAKLGYNSIDGATLDLLDGSNRRLAIMQVNVSGGAMYVANNSGTVTGTLQNGSAGGAMSVSNTSGTRVASVYVGTYGGSIYIANTSGTSVGYMQANSANGASLGLKDSAENINILCSGDTGNVRCVSLTQTSSRKVKKNITDMTSEEARKLLELEPVSFDYKNEAQGKDRRGFIAEDVAKVLPNVVTPETENAPASLDYVQLVPYLVKMVQEQQKDIEELKKKIEKLGG